MKLLILRGDLQSQSGYSAAIRAYCAQLEDFFDHIVGVDIHFSPERPFERFSHPVISEEQADCLATAATFTLALSITTPDYFRRIPKAMNVGMTFWETDLWPMFDQDASPWIALTNRMDALWAPSQHAKSTFRKLGVSVPIRVIPWPVETPPTTEAGLPEQSVYNLDRQGRDTRVPVSTIPGSGGQSFLCVAQDVPRKGLPLLLSEWIEFKRRPEAASWTLILKSKPHCPTTPRHEFVARFLQHVHALKRQAGIRRAGIYLWVEDLNATDFDRLLANTFGSIVPSMGEGFCGPAALALALKKPLVAPRHTSLADYLAADYPYCFATRLVRMRFANDDLYGVHSTWHVAEPYALANALSRVVTDSPIRCEAACLEAQDELSRWCCRSRVRRLLAGELERLSGLHFRLANELPPELADVSARRP